MRAILIIILAAYCSVAMKAQSITQDLNRDLPGQGKIVVNHSAEIESLVNAAPKEEKNAATKKHKALDAANTQAAAKSQELPATAQKPANSTSTTTAGTTAAASAIPSTAGTGSVNTEIATTAKKSSRRGYKTTGYRIQVYSGGNKRTDRTRCEQIAAQLRRSFPELPVYVHFYSPSWKCRAGNFTDYSEAQSFLKEVKAMGYSQACLVKGTIVVYN